MGMSPEFTCSSELLSAYRAPETLTRSLYKAICGQDDIETNVKVLAQARVPMFQFAAPRSDVETTGAVWLREVPVSEVAISSFTAFISKASICPVYVPSTSGSTETPRSAFEDEEHPSSSSAFCPQRAVLSSPPVPKVNSARPEPAISRATANKAKPVFMYCTPKSLIPMKILAGDVINTACS